MESDTLNMYLYSFLGRFTTISSYIILKNWEDFNSSNKLKIDLKIDQYSIARSLIIPFLIPVENHYRV